MKTTEKLAKALEMAKAPASMIADARAGRYDDFKSDSATPITDLVRDCLKHGLRSMAQRAKNGEFDTTREEAEEWNPETEI